MIKLKNYILCLTVVLMSCQEEFKHSDFEITPNSNHLIIDEKIYGDAGGKFSFYEVAMQDNMGVGFVAYNGLEDLSSYLIGEMQNGQIRYTKEIKATSVSITEADDLGYYIFGAKSDNQPLFLYMNNGETYDVSIEYPNSDCYITNLLQISYYKFLISVYCQGTYYYGVIDFTSPKQGNINWISYQDTYKIFDVRFVSEGVFDIIGANNPTSGFIVRKDRLDNNTKTMTKLWSNSFNIDRGDKFDFLRSCGKVVENNVILATSIEDGSSFFLNLDYNNGQTNYTNELQKESGYKIHPSSLLYQNGCYIISGSQIQHGNTEGELHGYGSVHILKEGNNPKVLLFGKPTTQSGINDAMMVGNTLRFFGYTDSYYLKGSDKDWFIPSGGFRAWSFDIDLYNLY